MWDKLKLLLGIIPDFNIEDTLVVTFHKDGRVRNINNETDRILTIEYPDEGIVLRLDDKVDYENLSTLDDLPSSED